MPSIYQTEFPPQRKGSHSSPASSSTEPGPNHSPQGSLPTELSISPITTSTLPAYRRLITLLLPIRYQDKFYKDSIANPSPSSLALCALWHETPRPGKRKPNSLSDKLSSCKSETGDSEAKVIGGIQCRLEAVPSPPPTNATTSQSSHQQPHDLYIQTLAILAPYRHLGIATALLDAIICTALTHYPRQNINVKRIYAHVWEANEEALEWYGKRGFEIGEEVVEGYYRKLRPSGAKVVRRRVGVGDWVGVAGAWEGQADGEDDSSGESVKQGLVS